MIFFILETKIKALFKSVMHYNYTNAHKVSPTGGDLEGADLL